jgi:hypothetical protein
MQLEIRAGDHVPDLPFVIVNRQGIHLDLTGIGELWDGPTTTMVVWGLRNNAGIEFGQVTKKDGTSRNFHDRDLCLPYLKAHARAWVAAMEAHDRAAAAVANDVANVR